MAKSYVRYTELLCEEHPVNCIYLVEGYCTAQPTAEANMLVAAAGYYKPDQGDLGTFCAVKEKFKDCPRFVAYLNHLRAIGLEKE
jgi:hypothetical protein